MAAAKKNKKKPWKTGASIGHITNLKQSIFETFSISMCTFNELALTCYFQHFNKWTLQQTESKVWFFNKFEKVTNQVLFHFPGDSAGRHFGIDGVDSLHFTERRCRLGHVVEPSPEEVSEACDVAIKEVFGLWVLDWHHLEEINFCNIGSICLHVITVKED